MLGLVRKAHGWLYSTEGLVDSRDSGRHIDMLLRLLEGKNSSLERLRQNGCDIDIVPSGPNSGQAVRHSTQSRCSNWDHSASLYGGKCTLKGQMKPQLPEEAVQPERWTL